MALHLPELTYKHMPIVKTARINRLIADKTKLMDEAAGLQHEINRLTEIEQSKVFRAYQRLWMEAGKEEDRATIQQYARLINQYDHPIEEYESLVSGFQMLEWEMEGDK